MFDRYRQRTPSPRASRSKSSGHCIGHAQSGLVAWLSPEGQPHRLHPLQRVSPARWGDSRLLRSLNVTCPNPLRRLIHVWSDYDRRDAGATRRHRIAKQTWTPELSGADSISCVVHENAVTRNANMVGEDKPVPFVRDLFIEAANRAGPQDIILFTNDDTCLRVGAAQIIVDRVREFKAVWCARREITRISTPLTVANMMQGYKHCGADIFAFTREWWDQHGDDFPDFLLSFEIWDLVLKRLILLTGGVEVHDLCYHEIHQPYWHMPAHRECVGNLYNRELGRQWLAKHNIQWGDAFK